MFCSFKAPAVFVKAGFGFDAEVNLRPQLVHAAVEAKLRSLLRFLYLYINQVELPTVSLQATFMEEVMSRISSTGQFIEQVFLNPLR